MDEKAFKKFYNHIDVFYVFIYIYNIFSIHIHVFYYFIFDVRKMKS